MKVKVCGITSLEQMQQLQQMGIDYAGLIFYEGSKRYAADKLSNQESAIKRTEIKKVGVFVNANYQTILNAIEDYGLTAVQLHGDETDEFCLELMDKAKVIKVFRIADQKNIDELVEPFQNVCHYFLFDTAPSNSLNGGEPGARPLLMQDAANTTATSKSEVRAADSSPVGGSRMGAVFGGTGKQFDWSVLQNAAINKPFFLSGGIGLEDAEKVKSFRHPYFFATDVNSCFETTPGIKDMKKVQQFINALNYE
jgi:phosphoribosylanthranilate isomerase